MRESRRQRRREVGRRAESRTRASALLNTPTEVRGEEVVSFITQVSLSSKQKVRKP